MNGVARKVSTTSQPWPTMFHRIFLVIFREKLSTGIFRSSVVTGPDRAETIYNLTRIVPPPWGPPPGRDERKMQGSVAIPSIW